MTNRPRKAPAFSVERYIARKGEVLLHMSHFFLQYLSALYQQFDGDLAMVIVLGEISHHNTSHAFSPAELTNLKVLEVAADNYDRNRMPGCNAYSLSCATGIPRQTVRRKIAALKKRDWIEEVPGYGLRISRSCARHFSPDFSIHVLDGLLRTARTIEELLAHAAPPCLASSSGPTDRPSSRSRMTV